MSFDPFYIATNVMHALTDQIDHSIDTTLPALHDYPQAAKAGLGSIVGQTQEHMANYIQGGYKLTLESVLGEGRALLDYATTTGDPAPGSRLSFTARRRRLAMLSSLDANLRIDLGHSFASDWSQSLIPPGIASLPQDKFKEVTNRLISILTHDLRSKCTSGFRAIEAIDDEAPPTRIRSVGGDTLVDYEFISAGYEVIHKSDVKTARYSAIGTIHGWQTDYPGEPVIAVSIEDCQPGEGGEVDVSKVYEGLRKDLFASLRTLYHT